MYLIYHNGNNTPKNKLEAGIFTFLKKFDRMLITPGALKDLQQVVLDQIESENAVNKRCRPVVAKFTLSNYNQDYHLFLGSGDTSIFNMTFLKTKD